MTDDGLGWFKPKKFGFGATPATWQGWAVLIGFVAMNAALGWALGDHIVAYLTAVGVVTVLLVIFVKRNTRGGWRWRWGQEK